MSSPNLTLIKAQCRQLNTEQKKELLNLLTEELNEDVPSTNKSVDIDDYVEYFPDYIPSEDTVLLQGLNADFDSLGIKGNNKKKVYTKWIGDTEYAYGNVRHPAFPLKDNHLPFIEELMNKLNNEGRWKPVKSCFAAWYPSNLASISFHSDNEENLDDDSSILTVSFGADRDVQYMSNVNPGLGILKTLRVQDRSLYVMKPGCQQLFRHAVPVSQDTNCGGRGILSFRLEKLPDENNDNMISSSMPKHYRDSDVSFGNKTICPPVNVSEKVSLILGASIIKELNSDKLAKGSNKCYVRATGGNKLHNISSDLDTFYEEHGQENVVKVFISAGVNDMRYCSNGIYHLKTKITQLINKVELYFPKAKIFFQSVLPVYIENRHTVKLSLIHI